MKNKRLVTENWYRFLNEDDDPVKKMLNDFKEEDPEAFSKMQDEMEEFEVDANELSKEELYKLFAKFAAAKETDLMTNRGTVTGGFNQKAFNQKFDVTGDQQFDLEDVKLLGDKSIPYAIYFGNAKIGPFKDENVSTKNSQVKALSARGVFKSGTVGSKMTAPYIIVYIIEAAGEPRFYVFNPEEALSMGDTWGGNTNKDSDIVKAAIALSSNFTYVPHWFGNYNSWLEEEEEKIFRKTKASSRISIKIVESTDETLLGRLMRAGQIENKYAYANKIEVVFNGSVNFEKRLEDALYFLEYLPMLTDVRFVVKGMMTSGMQNKIKAALESNENNIDYSYEVGSSLMEQEAQILEDFEMIQKIKERKNG
jgi:hypothetical protein